MKLSNYFLFLFFNFNLFNLTLCGGGNNDKGSEELKFYLKNFVRYRS